MGSAWIRAGVASEEEEGAWSFVTLGKMSARGNASCMVLHVQKSG